MAIQYEYEDNPINDTPVSVNTCLELEGDLSLECELEGELIGTETTPVLPVLIDKSITDNGTYHAIDDNADGYANVTVEVETDPPVLVEKSITENGTYLASEDEADGYSSVSVEVPSVVPTLIEKSVTDNGVYNASSDNADGYSKVTVEVPDPVLKTKSITENGTYLASSDSADGYSSVEVDVQPVIEPYIYNVGDVGFNSGHTHTANTKVRLKGVFGTWDGYGQAFGARSNNFNNSSMGFFFLFSGQRFCYYRSGQEKVGEFYSNAETTTSPWFTQPLIIECEGKTANWYRENDPNNIHTLTAENSTVNAGIAPLGIFCVNNSTTANGWELWDPAKYMTLYWLEIYENNVLEHRFVPAYNNGQYCLYDEVGQTYIYEAAGNYSRLKGSSNIPTT